MAVPRVFLSSTFYDLRQVRYNVGEFIKSLGYEIVMHERAGVPYSQDVSNEESCYNEISLCDIVICIFGNNFGSKSEKNENSITMNELTRAIKDKKKIYIFIINDVYIENKTYEHNLEHGGFKSYYTNDNKLHQFILDLKKEIKNNPIEPFVTTEDIINTLKKQFAGLFQNFLQSERSLTELKTVYDLQEASDNIKKTIEEFTQEKEAFFKKFEAVALRKNAAIQKIEEFLGIKKSSIFFRDVEALDEIMEICDYKIVSGPFDDDREYLCKFQNMQTIIKVSGKIFDKNGKIKSFVTVSQVGELITKSEQSTQSPFPSEMDDVPF